MVFSSLATTSVATAPDAPVRVAVGRAHSGRTVAPCEAVQAPAPRCPFARLGLDAIGSAGCAGFSPETVGFSHGPGASLSAGISCRHIRIAQLQGRHWPVCGHPDAPLQVHRAGPAPAALVGRRAASSR